MGEACSGQVGQEGAIAKTWSRHVGPSRLGAHRWSWGPDPVDLSTPDPPVPRFDETLEDLGARLRKQISTVRRTRDLESVHTRIQKLLDADEQLRKRQAESQYQTFDAPVFDTSFEKRRLRLLAPPAHA